MTAKSKGNSFERKVADALSKRFKPRTGIDKAFRRNIDSGSFFGGSNQTRVATHDTSKATFGDIICPDGFKFSIECKHYKAAPSFALILKQDCKEWDKWIMQASQDAVSSGKEMLLVIKYNNVDMFVLVKNTHGLPHSMRYKEYFVLTLDSFLTLDDSVFFE